MKRRATPLAVGPGSGLNDSELAHRALGAGELWLRECVAERAVDLAVEDQVDVTASHLDAIRVRDDLGRQWTTPSPFE